MAQTLAESAFSEVFVFRSPTKPDSEEATDVLVLFDDVGLVIEVKSRADVGATETEKRQRRWIERHLSKARHQLEVLFAGLLTGSISHLESRKQGRVPYSPQKVKNLYGLVLMNHTSPTYFPEDFDSKLFQLAAPVQVMSLNDFANLCRLLSTPMDLILYLESRQRVIANTIRIPVHGERSAFYYYLENLEGIWTQSGQMDAISYDPTDFTKYADQLRQIAKGTLTDFPMGRVIDNIIKKTMDLVYDVSSDAPRDLDPTTEDWHRIRVAEAFGRIPRGRRIALGKAFLRIAEEARDAGDQRWHLSHSKKRSDCLLLVADPRPYAQRIERAAELKAMLQLAQARHQVSRAVGVATEPAGQMGSSYDMAVIEGPPPSDQRTIDLAAEYFGAPGAPLFP